MNTASQQAGDGRAPPFALAARRVHHGADLRQFAGRPLHHETLEVAVAEARVRHLRSSDQKSGVFGAVFAGKQLGNSSF